MLAVWLGAHSIFIVLSSVAWIEHEINLTHRYEKKGTSMWWELQIKEIKSPWELSSWPRGSWDLAVFCVLGIYDTYQNHKWTYNIKFTSVIFFCLYLSDSKQYHVQCLTTKLLKCNCSYTQNPLMKHQLWKWQMKITNNFYTIYYEIIILKCSVLRKKGKLLKRSKTQS